MRTIGITHRRKARKEEPAEPTRIFIRKLDGSSLEYEIDTATGEKDFLKGKFPCAFRPVTADEQFDWYDAEKDPKGLQPYHCKWRKPKKDEDVATMSPGHVRTALNARGYEEQQVLDQIPTAYDGLQPGDRVATLLGGSVDRFAAALSRRGETIGASVYRIPPFALKGEREQRSRDKTQDHGLLAELLNERLMASPNDTKPFYYVKPRDRDMIRVKELFTLRERSMKARIACEQQILQAAEGAIFLNEDGDYPDGELEVEFKAIAANDTILQGMEKEEKRRMSQLQKAVQQHPLWEPIFEAIEGCGERITAGLIVPISNIRRFWVSPNSQRMQELREQREAAKRRGRFDEDKDKVADKVTVTTSHFDHIRLVRDWKREQGLEDEVGALDEALTAMREKAKLNHDAFNRGRWKLRKFCGVYARNGGAFGEVPRDQQFPRSRTGQSLGHSPMARQALYLLGDQFNRRPSSQWGQVLLQQKARLRNVHPEPEAYEKKEGGKTVTKKRYTDGHILKMAKWYALVKFVDHIFRVWTDIERKIDEQERLRSTNSHAA